MTAPNEKGRKKRRVGQRRWTTSQAWVVKLKAVVVRSDKAAVVMYRRAVAGEMDDGRLDRRRSLGQHREMPVERIDERSGRGKKPSARGAHENNGRRQQKTAMEPG